MKTIYFFIMYWITVHIMQFSSNIKYIFNKFHPDDRLC